MYCKYVLYNNFVILSLSSFRLNMTSLLHLVIFCLGLTSGWALEDGEVMAEERCKCTTTSNYVYFKDTT